MPLLDCVDVPEFDFDQPAALVGWLADLISAEGIIVVGEASVGTAIPLINCSADIEQLPV